MPSERMQGLCWLCLIYFGVTLGSIPGLHWFGDAFEECQLAFPTSEGVGYCTVQFCITWQKARRIACFCVIFENCGCVPCMCACCACDASFCCGESGMN